MTTLSFLGGDPYVFVTGDLEVKPLVVGALAGCIVFSQGDEVDSNCAQFFVNSSLSPVLLFRRRLKSVADVLKGIRSKGFYPVSVGYFGSVLGGGMSSWSHAVPFLRLILLELLLNLIL